MNRAHRCVLGGVPGRNRLPAVAVILITLGGAWWAVAGPALPVDRDAPEEMMSLAGMTEVRIEVRALPRVLETLGLSTQQVKNICMARLEAGNIRVVETEDAPLVSVGFVVNSAPDEQDLVGLIVLMGIYQPVRLHRLDRDMMLSTTTLVGGRVCARDKAVRFSLDEMNYYFDRFVAMVHEASLKMAK